MKEHRCPICLVALLLCCVVPTSRAQEPGAPRPVAALRSQLETYLDQPKFSAAIWGVKVVSLDTGGTVFDYHADRLMSPASNSKLYTGAMGLTRLGGDYRFATPVYAAGNLSRSGTLRGDLVIVGRGDPSWNDRRLGTNFWTIFDPFISILTNAGVHRITGDIVADGTFIRGEPTGASWTIDDLRDGEVGLISGLTLNDNLAQIRVKPGSAAGEPGRLVVLQPGTGLAFSNLTVTAAADARPHVELYEPVGRSVAYILGEIPLGDAGRALDVVVPRPADWFAAALKISLAQHGIQVSGRARGIAWPEPGVALSERAVKLGAVYSPALREVVTNFMKPSQNLETDLLLAQVGEVMRGSNSPASSEGAGLLALHDFLDEAGVPPGDVRFDEGSGLSRNNLTTANATVALLQYMARSREADDFLASLPIAGVDGSLRRRFRGTAAAGNVHAKTGTLRWANALSGYVTTAAGERLAFSFMLNRFVATPGRSGAEELDTLALMLAEFNGRTDGGPAKSYDSLGKMLVTQFASAPFPHPARAAGHRYHDEFYSAAEHYSDSTVALFVPKNYRAGDTVDFVVHFHGWRHTVASTLGEYQLVEQFAASGKNAVLVIPQGPLNVPDSFGGKLEDTNGFAAFMDEAIQKLRAAGVVGRQAAVGNVIVSGHSGGYHVMAAILDHGGMSRQIREVWLFDALYGNTDEFVAWQKREDGRMLNIYTDHGGTKEETAGLMAAYQTKGVSFFAAEDTNAVPQNLATNRLVFLHTDMVHDDVIRLRGTFGEFLKTSCLHDL